MKLLIAFIIMFSFSVYGKTTKTVEQQVEEATKLGLAYIMTNLYLEFSKYSFEKCKDEYVKYSSKKRTAIGDSINDMIYRQFITETIFEQYTDEEYGENVTKISLDILKNNIEQEFENSKNELDSEIKKRKIKKFCKKSVTYIKDWDSNSLDATIQFSKDIKNFKPNFKIDTNRLNKKIANHNGN